MVVFAVNLLFRMVIMSVAVIIMGLSLLHTKWMRMRLWNMEMMILINHIMICALEVDGLSARLDILIWVRLLFKGFCGWMSLLGYFMLMQLLQSLCSVKLTVSCLCMKRNLEGGRCGMCSTEWL